MNEIKCPMCESEKIYKKCRSEFTEFVNTGETFTHTTMDDGLLRCDDCGNVFNEDGTEWTEDECT